MSRALETGFRWWKLPLRPGVKKASALSSIAKCELEQLGKIGGQVGIEEVVELIDEFGNRCLDH